MLKDELTVAIRDALEDVDRDEGARRAADAVLTLLSSHVGRMLAQRTPAPVTVSAYTLELVECAVRFKARHLVYLGGRAGEKGRQAQREAREDLAQAQAELARLKGA